MDTELGALLDNLRKRRGWSGNELARRVGIDGGYLSRILKGKIPSEAVIRKFSKALQATDEDLVALLSAAGYKSPLAADKPVPDTRRSIETAIQRIPGLSSDFRSRLAAQLISLAESTESVWRQAREHGDPIPHVPDHGPEHTLEMLYRLIELFGEALGRLARRRETSLALLLQSLWLYDIGIVTSDEPDSVAPVHDERRQDLYTHFRTYPERSAKYVEKLHLELGLSKEHARVMTNLCEHHRDSVNLSLVEIEEGNDVIPAREQKALIALLRIADLLDVRPTRVASKQNLDEVMTNWQAMLEVRGEWLRNLFIARLRRERATLVAEIWYDRAWGQENIDRVLEAVGRELQGQINLVKDVLVDEADCMLLNARTDVSLEPPPTNLKDAMEKVRRRLGGYHSARHFIDGILDSLDRRVKSGKYDDVRDYVERELKASIGLRPYHAQVQNLYDDLVEVLNGKDAKERQLRIIEQVSIVYRNHKENAFATIAAEAHKRFCKPDASFLLFGYSECVLKALGEVEEHVRRSVDVTILEFRAKSLYDSDFKLEYCDGAEFAKKMHDLGYQRIWLAPDASISSVFELSDRLARQKSTVDLPKPPTHLIVGVNAITPDPKAPDCYGAYSTTGYQTVIEMAKKKGAEVYVIAETAKIRDRVDETPKERVHCWLAQDELWAKLMRAGIRIYNPLDDQIHSRDIDWFITDRGKKGPHELRLEHPARFSALAEAIVAVKA